MYNYDGNPILTNVTFRGNSAGNARGGGMYNESSSPTLIDVTFSGNSADYGGGGMYNESSSPDLTNVAFSNNIAYGGGGMYNESSSPILTSVTFNGNTASHYGGGLTNSHSNPKLSYVEFYGNEASGYGGGGIFNVYSSNPILTNIIFEGNLTDFMGGAIRNQEGSNPILLNVIFSGNSASDAGGGMANLSTSPTLTNVTFSSNTGGGMINLNASSPILTNVTFSSNTGGGIWNTDKEGSPIVTNSIFWGNTPFQIYGGTATVTFSDIQGGYSGTGNIDADPLLLSLADNGGFTQTIALGDDSPAIDAGVPSNCPHIDQRLYTRPIDGDGDGTAICDMGAYEYASYPATFSLTLDVVGSGSIKKDPDKSEYLWGEVITLTPTADRDWVFIGWSGDASSMDNPLTVTIYEDTNITANFAYYLSSLTVSVLPELSGDVTMSPNLPTYPTGSQVTITADPIPGWNFTGWSGDASGTENPLTITMLGDTKIFANLTKAEYTLTVAAYPTSFGSVTVEPVQATYHYGDKVTLTADGSVDHSFADWSGDASGTVNPLTVTITGNMNITANFNCLLNLTVTPAGSGSLTVNPNQPTYHCGTVVSLTAQANPGWTFAGWSEDASGSSSPINVTMNDNLDIIATFSQDEYSLTVLINPTGKGSVAISPSKPNYHYGDVVTLTATSAISGWRFTSWSGGVTGTGNPKTVTIQGNTNITANFSDQYSVTAIADPVSSGTITQNPNQSSYQYGSQVTLTANAAPGWTFKDWGAAGTSNPLTVTVQGNTSLTAFFTQNEYTLSVVPDGSGTVAKSPDQATYHYGTEVALTPTADPGWTFSGWSGGSVSAENKVTITSNTSLTATFTQDEYTLSLVPDGSGSVAVSPQQATYHYGTEVTLTPTANPGWTFSGWSGATVSSDNKLTITDNISLTATFIQNRYSLTVNINPESAGMVALSPDKASYVYEDKVTLTAIPNPGYTFVNWDGGATGTDTGVEVTIPSDTIITAYFSQNVYTLTVDQGGYGTVTISPEQGTYHYEDKVTLTANPNPGYIFAGWSGDASGSDNPLDIWMQNDKAITANWQQVLFSLYLPLVLK